MFFALLFWAKAFALGMIPFIGTVFPSPYNYQERRIQQKDIPPFIIYVLLETSKRQTRHYHVALSWRLESILITKTDTGDGYTPQRKLAVWVLSIKLLWVETWHNKQRDNESSGWFRARDGKLTTLGESSFWLFGRLRMEYERMLEAKRSRV